MAYESKEGSGAMFKADKMGNENRPDYRGDFKLNGAMYEIAGWIKEGKNGKYMSLQVKAKGEYTKPAEKPTEPMKRVAHADGLDDDLPFAYNACMYGEESPLNRRLRRAR